MLRSFRVKIDEKSLAMPDIADEQQQRIQFVQSISSYLTAATTMITAAPAAGPLLGDILLWAVRGFPMARTEEAAIEASLKNMLGTPLPQEQEKPAQTGKSPEELQVENKKVDQKYEIDKGRLQLDALKAEHDKQMKEAQLAFEKAFKEQELQYKREKDLRDAEIAREQVSVQRESNQNSFGLELGKLQTSTALDLHKHGSDSDLRRQEISSRSSIEQAKVQQSAQEQQQRAVAEQQGQQASQQQFQNIMNGLAAIMQDNQSGSANVAKSLDKILATITKQQAEITKTLTAPRRVVRGVDGKVERMEIGA
jgi:hypothetical protein